MIFKQWKTKFSSSLPSDLVALAHLIHAIRESAESSKKNGHGAGALIGNTTGVSDRREPARRRPVLEDGHVFHASHSWLLPDHCLRHLCVGYESPCVRAILWKIDTKEELVCDSGEQWTKNLKKVRRGTWMNGVKWGFFVVSRLGKSIFPLLEFLLESFFLGN